MASDPRRWMWAEALELLDRAERAHRVMFRPGPARHAAAVPCWEPPVDVFETPDALWIQVALPGVTADDVEVRIEDDALVVAGQRPLPLPRGAAGTIHRLETPHGRFARRLGLPAGRYELGRRDLAHGCLTLTLRKLA
jgi:HSP20 family molecular chaperone IbpA